MSNTVIITYLFLAAVCMVYCIVFFAATPRPATAWVTILCMGYVFVMAAYTNLILEAV